MSQVRRGMLVYDPFVGTGSILVAAAHHGAVTLGADIDPRVICLGKVRAGFVKVQHDAWLQSSCKGSIRMDKMRCSCAFCEVMVQLEPWSSRSLVPGKQLLLSRVPDQI